MLKTLRDSRVTLWLRHGSWDTQLPPPPYFEILICDTKAIKGVPSRRYGGRGRVPRR